MNKRPTTSEIENAFLPSREITDAHLFAGRSQAVEDSYRALLSSGSNIAVYGNRGIGKSSLARQIMAISNGNNDILEKLSIMHDGKLDFLTVYLACGGIGSFPELLSRLLTSNSCLADWVYDIPKARKIAETVSPKLNAGFVSFGGEKKEEAEFTSVLVDHDIQSIFSNVLLEISRSDVAKDGILIVVDEFDQIEDRSGFASFLKSLATNVPSVRFCLIGVANDIQSLMKEHQSADRLFAGAMIGLDPMSNTELAEIVDNAEETIDKSIVFSLEARLALTEFAAGHPYMIHLIGKYALRSAYTNSIFEIGRENINDALKEIAERNGDPILEGRYKKAVGHSYSREAVLKSLAEVDKRGETYTTDAYKLALDRGVDSATQYVGHLVNEDYGSEISKVRERYYRFKDSLFKAYVLARPWIFEQERAQQDGIGQ